MIYYSTKSRSYFVSFLFVISIIIFFFIIIPTLFIHKIYVPQWSIIELTYFVVTTNHMIGFGDSMPCNDLYGQSRSKCAMIMTSKLNISFSFILLFFLFFFQFMLFFKCLLLVFLVICALHSLEKIVNF